MIQIQKGRMNGRLVMAVSSQRHHDGGVRIISSYSPPDGEYEVKIRIPVTKMTEWQERRCPETRQPLPHDASAMARRDRAIAMLQDRESASWMQLPATAEFIRFVSGGEVVVI
jgi:hypothetical protein